MTFLAVHWVPFARAVRFVPTVLLATASSLPTMGRARVPWAELKTVLRTNGNPEIARAAAAILESDSSFPVIDAPEARGHAQAGSRPAGRMTH